MKQKKEIWSLKVINFNVHQWENLSFNKSNFQPIKSYLKDQNADIVMLNEVSNSSNEISKICKDLKYNFVYEKVKPHDFGNCVISKHKIERYQIKVVDFDNTQSFEDRNCVCVTVKIPIGPKNKKKEVEVDFMTLHLDHISENARMFQIKEILKSKCVRKDVPHIICGDFNANCKSDFSKEYLKVKQLERKDFGWEKITFDVYGEMLNQKYIDIYRVVKENRLLKDKDCASSRKVFTRIDYMFANQLFLKIFNPVKSYFDVQQTNSDHFPLVSTFQYLK